MRNKNARTYEAYLQFKTRQCEVIMTVSGVQFLCQD